MRYIQRNLRLLAALCFFIGGVTIFTASELQASDYDPDCKHCGSVEACNDGGQPYGMTECTLYPKYYGTPQGCVGWGTPCGSDVPIEN